MNARAWLFAVGAVLSSTSYADADCEQSDRAAGRLVVDLGKLKVHDDGNNTDYSFAICETFSVFDQKGRVEIIGSPITSTGLEAGDAEKLVGGGGAECISRGAPYSPTSAKDQRLIEYHLCQKDGVPSRLEVVARTLDKKGAPKPPQTLAVPFPDLRARPKKYKPFVDASLHDKQVSCNDGERALGTLDAKDDANLTQYRFVVCLAKGGEVTVRSNFLTSTSWDKQAVSTQAQASECRAAAAPYGQQGPGDERAISYRLCGQGGKAAVEVEAVMLDATWVKRPAKKLSVAVQ